VAEQFKTQFTGDPPPNGLQFIAVEFNHFPGLSIDRVEVMLVVVFLEKGTFISNIHPFDHAEKLY
jgi:hypothetical protein